MSAGDPGLERLTHRAFARMVIEAVREAGGYGRLEYDADRNAIEQGRSCLCLEGALESYRAGDEEARRALLARLVEACLGSAGLPASYALARQHIRPVIERVSRLEAEGQELGCDGKYAIPHGIVTPHLAVTLAWIGSGTWWYLDANAFRTWDVPFEIALVHAFLAVNHEPAREWRPHPGAEGVFHSPWSDGLDASRLLSPDLKGSMRLRGHAVAVAPTPSDVLVAGSVDRVGLHNLGLAARRIYERNPQQRQFLRPIRLFRTGWDDWLPDDDHPAYASLLHCALAEDDADHAEQARRIRRVGAAEGGESDGPMLVPASYHLAQVRPGRWSPATIWTAGAPHALPDVEVVHFQRDGEDLGWAPFATVRAVLGDALRPMGVHPPRWRADAFPTDAQRAAMGLRQGPLES